MYILEIGPEFLPTAVNSGRHSFMGLVLGGRHAAVRGLWGRYEQI